MLSTCLLIVQCYSRRAGVSHSCLQINKGEDSKENHFLWEYRMSLNAPALSVRGEHRASLCSGKSQTEAAAVPYTDLLDPLAHDTLWKLMAPAPSLPDPQGMWVYWDSPPKGLQCMLQSFLLFLLDASRITAQRPSATSPCCTCVRH